MAVSYNIVDVWLFKHDGPESLEMATTNEVAQSAWLDKGQIKELFDNGEFVDTLGYFLFDPFPLPLADNMLAESPSLLRPLSELPCAP